MKKNIFKFFFLLIGCFCVSSTVFAQTQKIKFEDNCGAADLHEHKMKTDAEYAKKHNKMEDRIYERTINHYNSPLKSSDNTQYTIPVVFHLVHSSSSTLGNGANMSTTQVEAGLQYLNDAFANTNGSQTATGVDINIDFCLAVTDPDGNSTTGIEYIEDNTWAELCKNTEGDAMKADSYWDTNNYMNVWVVEIVTSEKEDDDGNIVCTNGLAGFATLPGAHGNTTDGIVIEYDKLLPPNIPENEARSTFPHEVGHYLNLYHTYNLVFNAATDEYEPACNNTDCMTQGDLVCDTPPTLKTDCDDTGSSCSTDTDDTSSNNPFYEDEDDLTDNYLSKNKYGCRFNFTDGQRTRMRIALEDYRSSLLESEVCCITPTSGFTYNPGNDPLISFNDNYSDNGDSYLWDFGDGTTSTDFEPNHVYEFNGTYNICLTVTNASCGFEESSCRYNLTITNAEDPCSPSLSLSGNLNSSELYSASNYIETSENIQGNVNVIYKSNTITLTDGFFASSASNICVQEGGCNASGAKSIAEPTDILTNNIRNYPDPFETSTIIEYELIEAATVSIVVYDATGKPIEQLLDNTRQSVGTHQVTFDAQSLPDGMYFYAIQAGDYFEMKKMMLLR